MCAADTGFHQLSRDEQMSLARKGTGVFVQNLARLTDDELREPSLLAEWSRAHLVAHVGYNAAALCNLMSWAASGTESPMYSSAEQRNSEIENGSTLPAQALRSLVDHTAARLDEAWRSLPADRWNAQVRTAQGRTVPVSEVIWMRSREVWIHSVDLDNGVSFADFGEPVLLDLRSDIVSAWRRSGTGGEIRLVTPDATIELDPDVAGTRSIVEGSLADVVAWMAGRANSVTDLAAPRWL
ncbi:maleylpyruvate isomerase family mycothiol-dependent enzyme [Gordonia sp. NPDC003429]